MKIFYRVVLVVCVFMSFLPKAYLQDSDYNLLYRSKISFPGEALANIWGYTDGAGREYALVGSTAGVNIVEVTNPDQPVFIVLIPGTTSFWREIKSYGHFAYVTNENGGGLQIIDLSGLPSPNLSYHNYTGDGVINGQLNTTHALQVDLTKGYCYLYGHNIGNKGALALDLNVDPYNPIFAGMYNENYIHDGFADNDTLYAGQIYIGNVAIIDFSDKSNPVVLQTQTTPSAFTHNTWLTDDHKTLLTTDEKTGAYLGAFDISNLSNIQETDRFQTTPGSGSVPHNTYVKDHWAVTSWYKDGVSITDVTRPHNIIQTAYYDTYTPLTTSSASTTGGGYEGCWGVYPYFPSGTLVASNIPQAFVTTEPGTMFVLTPNYIRACYLEGIVTDSLTNLPLNDVSVTIQSGDPLALDHTKLDGAYATGEEQAGVFEVKYEKTGYVTKQFTVNLVNGQVVQLNVALAPPVIVGAPEVKDPIALSVQSNPFSTETLVNYRLEKVSSGNAILAVYDLSGKQIITYTLPLQSGSLMVGADLPAGTYVLRLQSGNLHSSPVQVIKN